MKKRFFTVFLAVCLLLTLLPTFAAADGGQKLEVTTQAELLAALASDSDVDSITITGSVTLTADCSLDPFGNACLLNTTLYIAEDATVTLDAGSSFGVPWSQPDGCTACVVNNGTLNVKVDDGDEVGFRTFGYDGENNGILNVYTTVESGFNNSGTGVVNVQPGGTLATTMGSNIDNSGVINVMEGTAADNSDAGTLIAWKGGILVNHGTIVMNGTFRPYGGTWDSDGDGIEEYNLFFENPDGTISCTTSKPTSVSLEEDHMDDIPDSVVTELKGLFPDASVTVTTLTGYWVTMTGSSRSVIVGDAVNITVLIEGDGTDETLTWNALDMLLTYDSSVLQLVTTGIDGYKIDSSAAGKIHITRCGEAVTSGTGPFTLQFTAIACGDTDVWPFGGGYAYVDKSENAVSADAPAANVSTDTWVVVIGYPVSLGDDFTGEGHTVDGEEYTFEAKDKNYDYTVSAKIGGADAAVTANGDGSFTIAADALTGSVVIGTASKTAKSYSVTFSGTAGADIVGADTAVYGTDYVFSVTKETGFDYESPTVTVGGSAYTGFTAASGSYTIPGADITGAIVITAGKSEHIPETYSVAFSGTAAGAASGAATATEGADYSFTVTAATGYDYTVSAAMDGENVAVTANGGGSYTIANVSGSLAITVDKAMSATVAVSAGVYVDLDGTSVFLIKASVTGELPDGMVPTYDGEAMYWIEAYDAYCWLVISGDTAENVRSAAESAVTVAVAELPEFTGGLDVNMTGKVDINDAQLAYDIYKAQYADFDTVSMVKMLTADVNGDEAVDTLDAAAIVNSLYA